MNSRSLVLAAVALLVGIRIGVLLQSDPPEARPAGAPARSASQPQDSEAIDESASEWTANTKLSAATEAMRAEAPVLGTMATTTSPCDCSVTPQADRSFRDLRAGEALQEREYRDEAFAPDEPGLLFPIRVDEDGAAEDFERFGDGPVSRSMPEAEDRPTEDRATEDLDVEPEAEACLPPFSGCRQDVDCCGTSVCRSRPGTISGHFECTPL